MIFRQPIRNTASSKKIKPRVFDAIIGKDEVASSNLASSSKPSEIFGFQRVSCAIAENKHWKVQNR